MKPETYVKVKRMIYVQSVLMIFLIVITYVSLRRDIQKLSDSREVKTNRIDLQLERMRLRDSFLSSHFKLFEMRLDSLICKYK